MRYSTYLLYMGNSTQFLHNLSSILYTASRSCTRRIIHVDASAASLLIFAKGTGHFGSRGVRGGWAGHGDFAPLAKWRERVGPSELTVLRRFASFHGLGDIGLDAWGIKGACDRPEWAIKSRPERTAIGKLRVPTAFSSNKVYSYVHLY